ncbi:hypothetical protein BGZ63DRAFT_195380 [Mariannaea sp. PMI_226]|nr:hypothetical protein BGZ63DRAFT_195380 [Mariannaea sp. PMI_226]
MSTQESKTPTETKTTESSSTSASESSSKPNQSAWSDDKRRKFERYANTRYLSTFLAGSRLTPTRSSKSSSEYYDPCQEAAQRSYRCLFRNGGDKSMCGEYFQSVLYPELVRASS